MRQQEQLPQGSVKGVERLEPWVEVERLGEVPWPGTMEDTVSCRVEVLSVSLSLFPSPPSLHTYPPAC